MPKPSGPTPNARSKAYLEAEGYIVAKVEQTKKFPDKKKRRCQVCGNVPVITILVDAFNFGDLLYFGKGEIGLVQSTSRANQSSRVTKVLGLIEARGWLEAGGKIFVHGWALEGESGRRKRWTVTIQEIGLDALESPSTASLTHEVTSDTETPEDDILPFDEPF